MPNQANRLCYRNGNYVRIYTLSSSPPSLWSKYNGITTKITLGGCQGAVMSYEWSTSSCQSFDDDDDGGTTSYQYYCTSDSMKSASYYGSSCDPKYPLYGYTQSGRITDTGGYSSNVYSCYGNNDDNSGGKLDQSNLTIFRSTATVNNCYSNAIYNNTYSIGSLYS